MDRDSMNGSRQRTLQIEHLEGTDFTPSGQTQIRLKGEWLAAVFQQQSMAERTIRLLTGELARRCPA